MTPRPLPKVVGEACRYRKPGQSHEDNEPGNGEIHDGESRCNRLGVEEAVEAVHGLNHIATSPLARPASLGWGSFHFFIE